MSPRRAVPHKKKEGGLPTWVIAVGIGVLVVIGVVVLFTLQTPSSTPASSSTGITTSGKTKGDPNAKIALVEFTDFK